MTYETFHKSGAGTPTARLANKGLELTASSVRSYLATASRRAWYPAFGHRCGD